MRRTPQFQKLTLAEASKLFEESFLSTKVTRIDRKSVRASFEKSPHTMQFGGYLDTEMSHKFKGYCEALVRLGFMDIGEIQP